ncbi:MULTISPECIES: hypothetical protein [unclassified Streptomyces]|uniref:hypothetical protein n=1 Tax=unclassified Streptomyces TaxID=2593676 RepID=UPI000B5051F9|nr:MULTISPECIES: hypothetical protein [unclassified Streptomyces]MYW98870.1 hypothetical protein [Streptomyces sp. SID8378]SNB90873.1 hypothetical protein SAMN02745831_07190 [Streptomyces sp. PgraA7]
MDEEAVRLADVLEAHPGASDAGAAGDIVFTAAGGTGVLDFQPGRDGEVFQHPTGAPGRPAGAPTADVLRDVVVPALQFHKVFPSWRVYGAGSSWSVP